MDLYGNLASNHVPVEIWEIILGHVSPADLGQAASINKACNNACDDQWLWSPHYMREWTLECCVSPYPRPTGVSSGSAKNLDVPFLHMGPVDYNRWLNRNCKPERELQTA
jgi:hypothetical protein